MSPARSPSNRHSGWNTWSEEVERLKQELAASRARERSARHEVEETRERFERLLDASRSFTRTVSNRKRQQQSSRQYLAVQHAVDAALAGSDSLAEAAADVLRALGENLGWQAASLWMVSGKTLRCVDVWHLPDTSLGGFLGSRLGTTLKRGEGLPGSAWATNRPAWDGALYRGELYPAPADPTNGFGSALAFPITTDGGPLGVVELLGGEAVRPDKELLYAVGLIGGRLGEFTDRRRAEVELREAEERLRLATEAGQVGMLDWDVATGESRCSGALAKIFGLPLEGATLTYEDLLTRVHRDDRERVRSTFEAFIADGLSYDLEFRIIASDGVRWVHLKGRVHTDEAGEATRVLGIMLDITEHKRAEREREQLRFLEASAQVEAAERDKISRELHDRVAHSMGVAYQSLQLFEALAEKDPERANFKVQTAKEMTKLALEQTRNLSMELRRSETENGLIPALHDLLEVAVPDEISAALSTSGTESLLSDHHREQLYVILREAVRNAVRHSDCCHLKVGLDITREEVSGYVEDDGRGFEDNGKDKVGLGLRSIKERVALLNGTTRMYSSPQGGAGVRIFLPLRVGGG